MNPPAPQPPPERSHWHAHCHGQGTDAFWPDPDAYAYAVRHVLDTVAGLGPSGRLAHRIEHIGSPRARRRWRGGGHITHREP